MEITESRIVKVTHGGQRIIVENPSENLIALLNNNTLIKFMEGIFWNYNSLQVYSSQEVEYELQRILDIIIEWGEREYRIHRAGFKYQITKTRQDYANVRGRDWESVSENEYKEFSKIASYEQAINKMMIFMPKQSDSLSPEITKFIHYYISTNPTRVLELTLNGNASNSEIAHCISRGKDIKGALREWTRGGYKHLNDYQMTGK